MKLLGLLLYVIPKNLLSYLTGLLVEVQFPGQIRIFLLKWFAKKYNLNMDEAEHSLEEYPSIGKLFTRKLKPGVRPIKGDLIHPVDSKLTQFQKKLEIIH